MSTVWSQKLFCHLGESAKMLKKNIPPSHPVDLFLTDPPYNIGHKYGNVSDRRSRNDYQQLIKEVMINAYEAASDSAHFFMIHYPEAIADMWPILAEETGWKFHQWITWAYPSNIGMSKKSWTRASRSIIWLQKNEGGDPKFYPKRIVRPYRNPWDKRVGQLIKSGKKGCSLYDWWEINLVKNVNLEKSGYSNQIPKVLLERIIKSTTDVGDMVADPFSGTYSTTKAALSLGRLGWGCDLNKNTKQYWPDVEDYNGDYIESDYEFDISMDFDHMRAGITENQFKQILQNGVNLLKSQGKKSASEKLKSELMRMGWQNE